MTRDCKLGVLALVGVLGCARPAPTPVTGFSIGEIGSGHQVGQLIEGRWRVHLRVTQSVDANRDTVVVGTIDATRHTHTIDFTGLGLHRVGSDAIALLGLTDSLYFVLGERNASHGGVTMWLEPVTADSAAGEWALSGYVGARGVVHSRRIQ